MNPEIRLNSINSDFCNRKNYKQAISLSLKGLDIDPRNRLLADALIPLKLFHPSPLAINDHPKQKYSAVE